MQTNASELDEFAANLLRVLMSSIPSQGPLESQPTPNVILPRGNQVTVAFTAPYGDSEPLYGTDRRLLRWLLRRALQARTGDISWETLMEYLGTTPTASKKRKLFLAAKRICSAAGTCTTKNGIFLIPLVRQSSSIEHLHLVSSSKAATGEISFEFAPNFLALVARSRRRRRSRSAL
jgi:hypothetical protein